MQQAVVDFFGFMEYTELGGKAHTQRLEVGTMRWHVVGLTFAAAAILTGLAISASAGVIASWDFDAQVTTPTQGTGTATLIGGVASAAGGQWIAGKTASSYTSWAWDTDTYPNQGQGSGTGGIQFSVSTGGYTGITVKFDKQHSATASQYVLFEFYDGIAWISAAPGSLMQETGVNWTSYSFDLSTYLMVNNNANFKFRMTAVFDPLAVPPGYSATVAGNNYSPQGTIAFDNVVVSGTHTAQNNYIEDVPDVNQPCANPLGFAGFVATDYCAPTSAVNITEYWDVVSRDPSALDVDGNVNPGPTSVLQFIGWWMNTNDDPAMNGCPYRVNGNPAGFSGTMLDDIAPGLVQYARWDATHDFGCSPPALLAGKNGYDWTAVCTRPGVVAGWGTITSEIDATPARPMIVCWRYWNPTNAYYDSTNGFTFCDWGAETAGSNDPSHKETWLRSMDIGHAVTCVGYKQNYDPRNQGNPKDWVIVHDNWHNTARDIAIPWLYWDQPSQSWLTHCTAIVTVDPATAPAVGTLSAATGASNPGFHPGNRGSATVMAQISLTASATEDILVNAIKLTASGTGDDSTEITGIDLVEDVDSDGIVNVAKKDILLVSSGAFANNNGTLTIIIPGNWKYTIKKATTSDLLIVYHVSPNAIVGNTFILTIDQIYATGLTSFLQCPVDDGGNPPGAFTFTSSTMTACTPPVTTDPGLGEWKRWVDGSVGGRWGGMRPYPVATSTGEPFYVQELDGSAGIKLRFVDQPPPSASPGDQIGFEGMIYTEDDERVILVTTPPSVLQPAQARTFAMPVKSIGGGDWDWDPVTHAGQKGVVGGFGLNNVGLLVRASGMFYWTNETEFTLGDGSGPPIRCVVPPSEVYLSPSWTTVTVTGVASTGLVGGQLYPVLRVRNQYDIVPR